MRLLLALALVAFVGAQDSTVYKPGDGVLLPQVTKQVKAEYTNEAMQNRIEGRVVLDVVVLADGAVGDVEVTESLDSVYGLDKNAAAAMRQWQFKPGQKDGKPVSVLWTIEYTFKIN